MKCPECNGLELVNEESGAVEFCRLCNGDGEVTDTDYENWLIDQSGYAKEDIERLLKALRGGQDGQSEVV